MIEQKRWRELVAQGVRQHQAIILFLPGRPARLHTHDFPEVFWVERGEGLHHINGQHRRLRTGDLVFIRPKDRHYLEAADAAGFVLINLAYEPAVRTDLLRRNGAELRPMFDSVGVLPHRVALPGAALAVLRHQLEQLSRHPASRAVLEHFLLGLHGLAQSGGPQSAAPMPDWLRTACERAQHPDVFRRGVPGLVRAAGRSAEHVARSVRLHLGMTPSDYLNRIRMDHAARQLRVTARPIADVAMDCGLGNLSHFYALFRAAHGRTPRAYRLEQHRIVA